MLTVEMCAFGEAARIGITQVHRPTEGTQKAKNIRSLSPPSGAPRRIGAVADEERSGPQSDRSRRD